MTYLAAIWSFDLQLIPPRRFCDAVAAPSVTPPEQPGVERETDGDDAAAN